MADLAMHGPARRGAEPAAIDELERGDKLLGEIGRPAAVIGERRHGRERVLIAGDVAEARLHAPDGQERPGRNAVALLDRGEERGFWTALRACRPWRRCLARRAWP